MQKTLYCEISFSRSARQLAHMFVVVGVVVVVVVVVGRVGLFSTSLSDVFAWLLVIIHTGQGIKSRHFRPPFSGSNREPMMFVSLLSANLIKC